MAYNDRGRYEELSDLKYSDLKYSDLKYSDLKYTDQGGIFDIMAVTVMQHHLSARPQ
jgi:hypothetical protein